MDFESTEQAQLFPSVVADPTVFYNLADEHTFPDCPIKEEQLDTTSNGSSQTPTTNGLFKEHGALQFGVHREVASAKHTQINPKIRSFQCAQCLKCFSTKEAIKEHLRIHTGAKPLSCGKCGMLFRHRSSFKKHQTSAHSHQIHERSFKCARCLACFVRRGNFLNHLLVHTGEKPYQCQVCGARFRQPGNLNNHKASVHSTARNHKCNECNKAYKVRSELMNHKRRVHKCAYRCDNCGDSFLKCKDFRQHRITCHVPQTTADIHTQHEDHQLCGHGFEASCETCIDGKAHPKCRGKKECDICGVFVSRAHFTDHRRVHTRERPYKCARCLVGFGQRHSLLTHLLIHTGGKPFLCEMCGMVFRHRGNLKKHQASAHQVHGRPFKCARCLSGFGQRQNLSTHLLIHTGEKPFQCEKCGKTFRDRFTLSSHQDGVHSAVRNHKCNECDKAYKVRPDLMRHKRIVHKCAYRCDNCGDQFLKYKDILQHRIKDHVPPARSSSA